MALETRGTDGDGVRRRRRNDLLHARRQRADGDGSWHVNHAAADAQLHDRRLQSLPSRTSPTAPAFADQYGNIVGCGHAPVSGPTPGDTSTTAAVTTTDEHGCVDNVGAERSERRAVRGGARRAGRGDERADDHGRHRRRRRGRHRHAVRPRRHVWYVYATSSVQHTASITPVQLDVQDAISIACSDIAYSGGARRLRPWR